MTGIRSRFFWKLFLGNALLLAVVVAACAWLIFRAFVGFHTEEFTRQLRTDAEILRNQAADKFEPGRAAELQALADSAAAAAQGTMRVTLVAADGTVLADSEADPRLMENHSGREEIRQALAQGWGESTRRSATVARELRYVAVRVGPAEAPAGVVRVAMPARMIVQQTRSVQRLLWGIAALVLAAAVVLALGLAHLWSGPITRITATARSLSSGDLSASAPVGGMDEVGLLARSLNQMRDHLAEQLHTIDRQRRTLATLVAQIHEGVLVAGPDGRIVLVNPTAVRMLDTVGARTPGVEIVEGRPVEECIVNPALRQVLRPQVRLHTSSDSTGARNDLTGGLGVAVVHRVAFSGAAAEGGASYEELRLTQQTSTGLVSILARASNIMLPALLESGEAAEPEASQEVARPLATGRLLVLTDITELARTIQVKTDFVANASHELLTPLAAIRAAVETLMCVDPVRDAESARRLVDVVNRHNARLEAMVADLLDLSRLESPSAKFEKTPLALGEVLADVHERFAAQIQAKRLTWSAEVPAHCHTLVANAQLLRLVLDNLVDNAVKFTDEGGRVAVRCAAAADRLSISVEDNGCGIPPTEHTRVFERFYQVQRSRSGPSRGTGLGLAIVRHAVSAMEGGIDLESAPRRGTRITIHLPNRQH